MVLPVSQIQNVLRTYSKQIKIARLNVEEKRQVVQGQVDRVEISEAGRKMLEQKPQTTTPRRNIPVSDPFDEFESSGAAQSETLDAVEDDDFNF